jgi:hypothetical protein
MYDITSQNMWDVVYKWAITVEFHDKGVIMLLKKTKLHGLSPQTNYTDRVTAACWRS